MKRGRVVALIAAASVLMGTYSIQAFTAGRENASENLPVLLKQGTVYVTKANSTRTTQAQLDSAGRGLYIVQMTGPVRPAYKSALARMGVEVGEYLPENAFLVRMNGDLVRQVQGQGFVKGVLPYGANLKLDRSLKRLAAGDEALVRVTTFSGGTKGPVGALTALGVKPESFGIGTMTARVGGDRLKALAESTDVIYVEPVRHNELFNDKAAGIMNVSTLWGAGLDGKGQVVAVTDTGLDTGKNDKSLHQDFQGQVKALYALGKTGDASDTLAHGTHVAGSVLGTGAASGGLHKGMAPGAKLVFQGVEDRQGGLGGIPSDLTQLFSQAKGAGAHVHTNSWGVPATSGGAVYDSQSAAVDRFIWENPDYAILFAAGNDGDHDRDGRPNYSTVSTPGTSKNAITVGASQNDRPDRKMANNTSGIASFSSRGPTVDGRVKPDVVAPGTWIASTRSSIAADDKFWAAHESNRQYGYMGGTSMSTPLTAGATALVRQFYVEKLGITPRASLLKATLINGAAPMESGLSHKDVGWGRVDLKSSLYDRPFQVVNEEKSLETGESAAYGYSVKAGEPLRVTLVWSDFPASTTASKTLVNDLDLAVKGPDGKVLAGNHMLGAGPDRTNNVENVVISAPATGTYTVTIQAHNVPEGPQRFALVVSGNVEGGTSQPTPPPQDPKPEPPQEDRQAPKVSISSPVEGSVVSGPVRIQTDATDNVGISKVLFYVNGNLAGETAAAPFEFQWDSMAVPDGAYSLVANAYDAAGNVGISTAVKVQVRNADATGLQEFTYTGKVGPFGTSQRLALDVQAPGKITADLKMAGWATVYVTLLDPSGKQVARNQGSLAANATVSGTYSILVTSYGGWGDYSLTVKHPLREGTAQISKSGSLSSRGERYHVIPVKLLRAGAVNAAVTFSAKRDDLDLYLVDSMGRLMAQAISPNLSPETVSASLPAGTYYLYVVADSGAGEYQLRVTHPR